ncbi:MAG: DUF2809 domain-containing protein [Planctomycetota bacterium]
MAEAANTKAESSTVRLCVVVASVLVVGLGLGTRSYEGPLGEWGRASGGGVFYVVLLALLPALVVPSWTRTSAGRWFLALSATALSILVELSQLWHTPWLDELRQTRVGALALGSRFSELDLIAYPLGGLVSGGVLALVGRLAAPRSDRRG